MRSCGHLVHHRGFGTVGRTMATVSKVAFLSRVCSPSHLSLLALECAVQTVDIVAQLDEAMADPTLECIGRCCSSWLSVDPYFC
jgi:hypothetical protein